ncbi:MAG TPA: caspase family protein [Bradyrhizobium sp.]|nr:caspase family protein [Bradyrhizobium sp.]
MRTFCAMVFAVCASWLFGSPALAEKRVALVIGNSAYENVARLGNPANDATAITTTLKEAGFEVVDSRRNLKIAEMRRVFRDFSDKARDADVAVVYYAGHGIELDGANYLIPVDAALERDLDVFDEAFPLDRILISIEPARQLRLVILDACRDNPFAKTMKRTIGSRAVGRGLAKVEPTSPNTLIAFASKAGSTASDGDSKNSPFTSALVKHIATPGLDLRKAFGYVRDDVLKNTSNKQEPYVYGSLGGDDVPLVPAKPVAAQPAPNEQDATMRRDYEFADRVGTKPVWDAFIERYPSGFFTALARAQRDRLGAEARVAATEKARLAQEEKVRLAAEGAKQAEQAKAAAQAKAAEEARTAAEKAKQIEQAKVAAAEQARVAAEKAAAESAAAAKAEAENAAVAKVEAESKPQEQKQQVTSLPAETPAPDPKPSSQEIVRSIQIELKRVGCFTGSVDGDWNSTTQRALNSFNKRAGAKLDVKLINLDLLDAIKRKPARVCPLICESGFRAVSNSCKRIVCEQGYTLNDDICEKRRDRFVRSGSSKKSGAAPKNATRGVQNKCFVYGGQSYCE